MGHFSTSDEADRGGEVTLALELLVGVDMIYIIRNGWWMRAERSES